MTVHDTIKDEDGKEVTTKGVDMDSIYKLAKNFVDSYNSFIDNASESNSKSVLNQTLHLTTQVKGYAKTFGAAGITIGKDNKFITEILSEFLEYQLSEESNWRVEIPIRSFIRKLLKENSYSKAYEICKDIKNKWGQWVEIMTGNIANLDDVYKFYADAGIDWVRCSIGSGQRCLDENTSILMSTGETKPIREICIGDEVITKSGIHKVVNVFNKLTDETLIINDSIECTPDHKFLVIRKDIYRDSMTEEDILANSEYIEANKLSDIYFLLNYG